MVRLMATRSARMSAVTMSPIHMSSCSWQMDSLRMALDTTQTRMSTIYKISSAYLLIYMKISSIIRKKV